MYQNNQGINKKIKLDPLQHKNYQNKDDKQCLFDWTRDHKGKNMTYLVLLMRITIRTNPWTSESVMNPIPRGNPTNPVICVCFCSVCVCAINEGAILSCSCAHCRPTDTQRSVLPTAPIIMRMRSGIWCSNVTHSTRCRRTHSRNATLALLCYIKETHIYVVIRQATNRSRMSCFVTIATGRAGRHDGIQRLTADLHVEVMKICAIMWKYRAGRVFKKVKGCKIMNKFVAKQ